MIGQQHYTVTAVQNSASPVRAILPLDGPAVPVVLRPGDAGVAVQHGLADGGAATGIGHRQEGREVCGVEVERAAGDYLGGGAPPPSLLAAEVAAVDDKPSPGGHVRPCCRCGASAELPTVGFGSVAGREETDLPLCCDCFQFLLEDVTKFLDGLDRGRPTQDS